MLTTVMDWKVLIEYQELLTLDEAEITAKTGELAAKVWSRYEEEF